MARTVLVVDDDVGVLFIVGECLTEVGYEVVSAQNGARALQLLQQGLVPDLILLDVRMPVMDGYAFRDRQLAQPEFARIPVVVMSGTDDCKEATERMCASGCIHKPMGVLELLSAVELALGPRDERELSR